MRLHHLAASSSVLTFTLMIMGSLVHGTGSSLACPDWPLCHGTAFPAMTDGVEFEHTHRLLAASVVVLTLVMFVRSRALTMARPRRLAALALSLVAVQASLGALTVLFRLPPAISVAHLATSMTFLFTMVLLATDRGQAVVRDDFARRAGRCIAVASIAVVAQAVLGAIVRHTGAALACTGVPLCGGRFWPGTGLEEVHMLHRVGAVLASAVTVASCLWTWKGAPPRSPLRTIALVPIVLVALQIMLGVAVVLSYAPLPLVTLHHATGALLVASLAILSGTLRSVPPPEETTTSSFAPAIDARRWR